MDEQNNFNNIPSQSHTPIYVWIIIVVLLLVVAGLGTLYFLQTKQSDEKINSLQSQIVPLRNDVAKLQQEKTEIASNLQTAKNELTKVQNIVSSTSKYDGIYNDFQTGLSFTLPLGWMVGKDEAGNTSIYKSGDQYSTIGFEVFADKTEWSKAVDNFKEVFSNDKIIKDEQTTLGGFSATYMVLERVPGTKSAFKYGAYFVDAGNKGYLISIGSPDSEDIQKITESINFGN